LIDKLNDYVNTQGNHGHGDDLQVMGMPETEHSLHLELWLAENMTAEQRLALRREVELMVKAAFRQSADYPSVTRVWPQSRFSLSQLGRELHQAFPEIKSLHFTELDIVSGLAIPRLGAMEVFLHD